MEWVAVQQKYPILKIVMKWISSHKVQDLKHLIADHATMEEGVAILREQKKFTLHQGAPYHCHTLARELEEALQFVVPTAHRVATMNGCHRNAGNQGQQQTLSLLKTSFGGMAWQHGCRRWSVALKVVFSMRVPEPRLHYKLFWSPLLWNYFMWISPALRWWWNWTNYYM